MEVKSGNEVIYRLNKTAGIWGRTTGNMWNFIELPDDTRELTVTLSSCYPETAGYECTYYIGTGRELYSALMRKAAPSLAVCALIMMVGLYMLGYWFIVHKSAYIDGTLLYLGVFSVLLGLWSANETDAVVLIIENHQASTFMAFVLLMAMPIPFALFVRSFLEIGDRRIWKWFCDISFLEMIICCVMQFTGVCDFRQSIVLTHIIIAGALLYLIYAMAYKIIKRQIDSRLGTCIVALGIIIVATIADMIRYYSSDGSSDVLGKIAFLLFILILGFESARKTMDVIKKGRRAEALEQFALNDSMTGLYNRNAYNYMVENESDITDHMVITFDLNDLKQCNDRFGHAAGDTYIINVAEIIERIFDRYGRCYRIGGDEFCCIVTKASSVVIEKQIMKLRHEITLLNNKRILPVKADIACGFSSYETGDENLEQIRVRADGMMYADKKDRKEHKIAT